MKKIIIAIDGPSACGKSSTAKQVAEKLGYCYLDSGAMYRAVTLCFIRAKTYLTNPDEVNKMLEKCNISLNETSILLNGQPVGEEIRTMEVDQLVSEVSAISAVRKRLVVQQQEIGKQKGIVMDGRDIGMVVFPHAELKVFMTADMNIRAIRRQKELRDKGIETDIGEIAKNLSERDIMDSTREDSPLVKAENAIVLDTTNLTLRNQVDEIVRLAQSRIREAS